MNNELKNNVIKKNNMAIIKVVKYLKIIELLYLTLVIKLRCLIPSFMVFRYGGLLLPSLNKLVGTSNIFNLLILALIIISDAN